MYLLIFKKYFYLWCVHPFKTVVQSIFAIAILIFSWHLMDIISKPTSSIWCYLRMVGFVW